MMFNNTDKETKTADLIEDKSTEDLQKILNTAQTHNLRLGKIHENLEKDQSRFLNKIMSLLSTYEEMKEEQGPQNTTFEEMILQAQKYCNIDVKKSLEEQDDDTKKNIKDYKTLVLDIN
ncbi:hypothetical protein ACO0R3_001895 [Hanseniaspora guilliermondii]